MLTNRDEENDNSTVEPFEIEGVRDEEVHRLISTPYQNARGPELSDKDASQRNLKVFILSIPVLLFLSIIGSITYINQINVYVNDPIGQYPPELLDNVYKSKDFRNDLHIVPPYWDEMAEGIISNVSVDAIPHMGPCFLPETKPNWTDLIERNRVISSEKDVEYVVSKPQRANGNTKLKLEGLCRPGFIIIGAGKCGTSSLYHYLVGHPRVLPAKNKQIHYFKYFTNYPMQWYLKHFPPAEVFLSNGALMTGEASPGYLPYPDVANRLKTWMQNIAGNGEGQAVVSPKIITIVRNPLDRSWSSYKYNYQKPLVEKLRKKDIKRNKYHDDDWYISKYIFSFEDLIKAELKVLKECLAPGGIAESTAQMAYGQNDWSMPEFSRRKRNGDPPLVTLDESCYGDTVSPTVPRRQWKQLVEDFPKKIIKVRNLHLVQSLVGRSLYALPLEWWYALFPKEDLYLFCTEDLKHHASMSMSSLADFLGLPSFDFTNITSIGMYNVGGNSGYDQVTKWNNTNQNTDGIPISEELRKEYLDFVQPFNERLYKAAGKRCKW